MTTPPEFLHQRRHFNEKSRIRGIESGESLMAIRNMKKHMHLDDDATKKLVSSSSSATLIMPEKILGVDFQRGIPDNGN